MKRTLIYCIILMSSLQVSAECLWRKEPLGAEKMPVFDFVKPNREQIYIFEEVNKACAKGSNCFVSTGDELLFDEDSYNLIWTNFKNDKTSVVMSLVAKNGHQPSYLHGVTNEGKADEVNFYVLYTAYNQCAANIIPTPKPSDKCHFYRFEIHPSNISGYIRPDHAVSDTTNIGWKSGCALLPSQPGGGNGNDPPRP